MRVNISRAHIIRIEAKNIDKLPSHDILFRICDILGVEPYQLFIEHEKENEDELTNQRFTRRQRLYTGICF